MHIETKNTKTAFNKMAINLLKEKKRFSPFFLMGV